MMGKILEMHLVKPAYVYLRQSTMGQVRFHQESTERQYALKEKARALGWETEKIKILDGDLGVSGSHMTNRTDFQLLVADVSMNKVGAVFALEASRLSRSNTDWHRLLELCSLTQTLIIDEDGCYNPADFNDQLLLGLKGTMSQAELHFIRARLQGGKLNKAKKGELRFPLPVGYVYNEGNKTTIDPDSEVSGAVRLVFDVYRETNSAYAVAQHFFKNQLKFPKRSYGGAWDGKLIWGDLSHSRVLSIIKNPCYAGVYVYGRHKSETRISKDGGIRQHLRVAPMNEWEVKIKDHHEGYISWDEYLTHHEYLKDSRTNCATNLLPGPAREGHALMQGIIFCSKCGRRLSVQYTGNGGIYPTYQCTWKKRDGQSDKACMYVSAKLVDDALSSRIIDVIQPSELQLAVDAYDEVERRHSSVDRQWMMKIERAKYDIDLAQRRYEQVDPSNRLVASTLERQWNGALRALELLEEEYDAAASKKEMSVISDKKDKVLKMGGSLVSLWTSKTTKEKDRKRILRLFIKDITVDCNPEGKELLLSIRWQGGAIEKLKLDRPLKIHEKWKHSSELIEKVKELSKTMNDRSIVKFFSDQGQKTNKGNPFTIGCIKWIRYKHSIPTSRGKRDGDLSVKEIMAKYNVSYHVVNYWIKRKVVNARKETGSPWWITLNRQTEERLEGWVANSTRI
jgi:DNA invertase Pin-like site-specific DNA recombinase